MSKIDLKALGLRESTIKEFSELYKGLYLGRVCCEQKNIYKIVTEKGFISAKVSGRFIYNSCSRADYPAVGDWVVLNKNNDLQGEAIIQSVLKRYSKFSRWGLKDDEQVIATNVDIAFITMSLNNNFNLRRLERYISAAWDSDAKPVVLLTKSDLCDNIEERLLEISKVVLGVDVLAISSLKDEDVKKVKEYITSMKTVVFIGSSGVGKSTIINKILGYERLKVGKVRDKDERGRHTTTYRELMLIPEGGVVIDTPGMREFQVMDIAEGLEQSFKDIEDIALNCKFSDCTHHTEPGCAVREAIVQGIIDEKRYKNYMKIKKEAEFIEKKMKYRNMRESKKDKFKKGSSKEV